MLRGNRFNFIAIGLALAFAVVTGLLLYHNASSLQASYERSAAKSAENYANRATIEMERCATLSGASRADCEYQAQESRRQGERDEYDLEAQRITAAWTAHMGAAAIIGMAVSILGVGLIYATFEQTRGTRRDFIESERAHLRIVGGQIGELRGGDRNSDLVCIQVKNIGRTNARVIEVVSQRGTRSERWVDIPAGEMELVAVCDPPEDTHIEINGWFYIRYRIVGGEAKESHFRMTVKWFDGADFTFARWLIETFSINGHPDDT